MSALARAGDATTAEQPTVHVIDDDVSLRDALGLMLPSVGLGVRTYTSVQEFLDAHAHDGPGCIVLDVRLPGISGLDFQSRSDRLGIHLPDRADDRPQRRPDVGPCHEGRALSTFCRSRSAIRT